MRAVGWALLNLMQVLFIILWTGIWVPGALVVLICTCSRRVPLAMARRVWAAGLLHGAGVRLEITGLANVDFSQPHVFVSNHESTIDIPVVFRAIPVNIHFIIKRELLFVPFIGLYAWAMGMIFVDRHNKMNAFSSLKRVGRLIREGRDIIAFPEGTRTRDGGVLPFKKGIFVAAAEAGVPVVPVAIAGAARVMPANSFRIRPGVIRVAFGRPILTSGPGSVEKARLTEAAHAAVAALRADLHSK